MNDFGNFILAAFRLWYRWELVLWPGAKNGWAELHGLRSLQCSSNPSHVGQRSFQGVCFCARQVDRVNHVASCLLFYVHLVHSSFRRVPKILVPSYCNFINLSFMNIVTGKANPPKLSKVDENWTKAHESGPGLIKIWISRKGGPWGGSSTTKKVILNISGFEIHSLPKTPMYYL